MNVTHWLDQRLALPGDSETRRSQKTISVIVMLIGSAFTLLNVLTLQSLGLTSMAIVSTLLIVLGISGSILVLLFPRTLDPLLPILVLSIIPIVLAIHMFSGGFQSGMEMAIWMLIVPIGAALFISLRFTIVSLLVYIVGVIVAVFLEPFSQTLAPEIALSSRMQIAAGNLIMIGLLMTVASLYLLRQVNYYQLRADKLLFNLLPSPIAARLKAGPGTIADSYDEVSVLFADMTGSTPLFAGLEPAEAVDWLNEVFSMFDHLVEKHGVEKIRTIGDNYMVASGVPLPRADHAQAITRFALDMVRGLEEIPARKGKKMQFRVGIHCGPLVAGVIGRSKYQYDLWGDTVNIASRMESHGEAGKVHVSSAIYERVKDEFECESRGAIPVKGKGEMETWFLVNRKEMRPL